MADQAESSTPAAAGEGEKPQQEMTAKQLNKLKQKQQKKGKKSAKNTWLKTPKVSIWQPWERFLLFLT
tara:strand:- start:690 stop:893 length:204 start_codon:yes stop_codon:yes gene_type:complete